MKRRYNIGVGLLILILLFSAGLSAQTEDEKLLEKEWLASRDLTYQANNELVENDFHSAEANYRRAISKSDSNAIAPYNLGNSYYNRESFGEAFGRFKQAGERASDKASKHKAFHNMGNVFMKNEEYAKAVEAYKEALRNNPKDEETRYNLALAKEMMKKEQQNQDQNKDDQNKDNQNDEQEKNQDQQSQGGDEDDQQEQKQEEEEQGGEEEAEQNKSEDGSDNKKPQQEQQEQQKPRPNQLSKQQIESLLEAMQNEEKKVQEKMDAKKIKGPRIKNEKDW